MDGTMNIFVGTLQCYFFSDQNYGYREQTYAKEIVFVKFCQKNDFYGQKRILKKAALIGDATAKCCCCLLLLCENCLFIHKKTRIIRFIFIPDSWLRVQKQDTLKGEDGASEQFMRDVQNRALCYQIELRWRFRGMIKCFKYEKNIYGFNMQFAIILNGSKNEQVSKQSFLNFD